MKRFIAGLTFALTLTATAHAQEYQTVSQLRESVPARWTTKVETKWRDVDIDAEIVTPDVETIPVMKVGYDLHHALLTPEESGWDEVDDTYDVNGLILCQEGISYAADRSRETGTLTGLEKNDQNNAQATQHLQNGKKELHNGKPPYIYAYANIYKLFQTFILS